MKAEEDLNIHGLHVVSKNVGGEIATLLAQASYLAHQHKLNIAFHIDEVRDSLQYQWQYTDTFED